MSESAGKTRRAAEVAANVAGATERRRVQSIREPLSPGAYVEYSVDDQPGVVERAPEGFQKLGLEWLYRLVKEPKRIGRMAKLPLVLVQAAGARLRGK
mgnify:CR=1 FL=1